MAHRSDDVEIEIVRSVGNPLADEAASGINMLPVNGGGEGNSSSGGGSGGGCGSDLLPAETGDDDADLPQCKIKRNYSCSLCPFFSQNPRSFLYHSRDVHFDRIKIFECSQCLYASKHSQKLQRHINMIHVAGKNRVKKSNKIMKVEKKKEPRAVKPRLADAEEDGASEGNDPDRMEKALGTGEENPVGVCDEDDVGPNHLDGHFKCSACDFRNKNAKLMRRHEKVVHLKKRFLRCSKCSYVTHVKARYTKHVKYHSMPMIKCDLCDFRTPYKWNLDRHYKNHCGTGAFQCSKCNFRADIKQSLTVHEMNHHVPPVGQGAVMARKRNKVGASEMTRSESLVSDRVDFLDLEALEPYDAKMEPEAIRGEGEGGEEETVKRRNEGENNETDIAEEANTSECEESGEGNQGRSDPLSLKNIRNVKIPYTNKRETANSSHLPTDFIHPDDIVPRYGQIYVKNLKCKFCSYKAVFSHEIGRHEKRIHGYVRPESKKGNQPKRPPPRLIPIQNKCNPPDAASNLHILKIPAVKKKATTVATRTPPAEDDSPSPDKTVNENEFHEMCKKSSLTSSLKDFVSLIGDEEGLKTIPDSSRDDLSVDDSRECTESKETVPGKQYQANILKKKNESFFDLLKEKLLTGNGEDHCLWCEICGHESKCLSEAVAHEKRHSESGFKNDPEAHQDTDAVFSGAELSSTRCQHCRQRCKTSVDLLNHLKSCKAFGSATQELPSDFDLIESDAVKTEELSADEFDESEESMENRVFVWNDLGQRFDDEEEREAMAVEIRDGDDFDADCSPLYGTVTNKGSDNTESGTLVVEIDPRLNLTVKKVFKCPHCSFWASTASRFHVHIVGHLNKKPFECSLCSYRSNWRWDITKHIRLKSARDPSHVKAQVNMTDETGRRNYSKYNKYLTMMKVQEPSGESSGSGRRSKPGDATQGNVAERDIIPLPAPPRLTRAPPPGTQQQMPEGLPLRPPPPLKAAHRMTSLAGALATPSDSAKESTKRSLWKCKKCNFRDSCKSNVLVHVKEHYGSKYEKLAVIREYEDCKGSGKETETSAGTSEEAKPRDLGPHSRPPVKTPSYRCGHCQQVSNWKHVIQRHCRLKHNGNALIQVGWKEEPSGQVESSVRTSSCLKTAQNSAVSISCDICPFTTDTEGDLTAHKLNHVDRPGSIFKCSYCPFYVPSKTAVLEHMEIHGVGEGCDTASLKVDNFDPSECNQHFSTTNNGDSGESSKRYKCRQCPYVSNSRTQFLYHKQFHRPRDAPFKCMYCSYNVSRRHLLHQHLRVHYREKEEGRPKTEQLSSGPPPNGSLFAGDMPEIPLVWVSRAGSFQKMFKCRWCPHVNARKLNIQDHEKMHRVDEESGRKSPNSSRFPLKFYCPDCNYTCNNAGVLASHAKVHQGYYGEIRCLVDPTRPEIDQIRELQVGSQIIEPEVVIREEADIVAAAAPEQSGDKSFRSETACALKVGEQMEKVLSFCDKCPARFLFRKELRIHLKFHTVQLPFRCTHCSYAARQRPHLLAHYKVHGEEYQRRTVGLLASYGVSPEFPRPNTIAWPGHDKVWTVAASRNTVAPRPQRVHTGRPGPKHPCCRCPARFFKAVALQYHLSLHGVSHPHKCKYCDYAVKSYGNLIKHQLVHEQKTRRDDLASSFLDGGSNANETADPGEEDKSCRIEAPREAFPEFVYPMDFNSGKAKEKKYKCRKCPSVFEKRVQYRIHMSLHGSKQKYKCEICDYSVKYYANYVQHVRKHQIQSEKAEEKDDAGTARGREPPGLGREHACDHCPYSSVRKHVLDCHVRKHFIASEVIMAFACPHCDYSVAQETILRDHIKVHFRWPSRHKAEAYLKCDEMELWCREENADNARSNFLVFQDRGTDAETRFLPPLDGIQDEKYIERHDGRQIYHYDLSTGEMAQDDNEGVAPPITSSLLETAEELYSDQSAGHRLTEKSGPKRWRKKNWKCKKCPHAFVKRDQYARHAALHGSKQRHTCDICDYSVRFYTNYVQHMRMHQSHEPNRVISVKGNREVPDESGGGSTGGAPAPRSPEASGCPGLPGDTPSDPAP